MRDSGDKSMNAFLVALLVAEMALSRRTAIPTPSQQQSQPELCQSPLPQSASRSGAGACSTRQRTAQPGAGESAQPVLRSSSDLVRIDVEVTDRSGKPSRDSEPISSPSPTMAKPQKVSIFSYEDIEASKPPQIADTKPIVRRRRQLRPTLPREADGEQVATAACWCFSSISPRMAIDDLVRAHDAAAKFVKQQMSKADLVSVVVLQLQPSRALRFHQRPRRARTQPSRSFFPALVAALQSALRRRAKRRIRRAAGYRRRLHRR